MTLDVYATIAAKRDGRALRPDAWSQIIEAYMAGAIAEYQMSALLMAVAIRGMDLDETAALTEAMVASGERLDLTALGVVVDKHSTGGVGDKTSLVAAPLAAAAGVRVAKMSGRGLGHTGGTIDKLESIPGFDTALGIEAFVSQVARVGVAVIAQLPGLDPADKALYALRDVTGTVESVPLIAASIVSKKAAAGARAVVFDVKTGSGAFMRERAAAEELGATLVALAQRLGLEAQAVLSSMDQPLGRAVGNALEVAEAIETLRGGGPEDLKELSQAVAARMVALARGVDIDQARKGVADALAGGRGLETFVSWISAQGGDPRVAEDTSLLPSAPVRKVIKAPQAGMVTRVDALAVGRVAMALGAGRRARDAVIDPRVGIVCCAKVGEAVSRGDALFEVHAADDSAACAAGEALSAAIEVGPEAVSAPPTVVLADPLLD